MVDEANNSVRVNDSVHQRLKELGEVESTTSLNSTIRILLDRYDTIDFLNRFEHNSRNPIQPVEGVTLPEAIFFCPICGNPLGRFQFTESSHPQLARPAFLYHASFSCNSEDCQADGIRGELRHGHHLVAVSIENDRPTDEEMEAALTSYWDSVLPAEDMEASEREFRVTSWAGLAKACGWKWRPPLSLWREFTSLEEIMDSVGALLDDQDEIEVSTIAPDSGCCATEDWHFHITISNTGQASEGDQSGQAQIRFETVALVEEWLSDSSVEVEVSDEGGQQSLLFHGI